MAKAPQKKKSSIPPIAVYAGGAIVIAALLIWAFWHRAPNANDASQSAQLGTLAAPITASPSAETVTTGSIPVDTAVEPAPAASGTAAPPPITRPAGYDPVEPSAAEVVHVPRTTPEDLLAKLSSKSVTVIDVRDADSYAQRHIPGAIHIPFAIITSQADRIPKGKPIVTVCT